MRLFTVSKQAAETGSDLYSITAELATLNTQLNVAVSALHQHMEIKN